MNQDKQVNIVMILDESGSMYSNKKEILETINKFLNKQKSEKVDDNCNFTLIKFHDEINLTIDRKKIDECKNLTDDDYTPQCCTALYDAIGFGIEKFHDQKDVIMVIVTDGVENASKKYNQKSIKETLEQKVNPDTSRWNVIHLCNNPLLFSQGASLGIVNDQNRGFTSVSSPFNDLKAFERQLSDGVSNFRSGNKRTVNFQ